MSEPQSAMSFGPGGDEPPADDGHLRYLLTAYLLGDLSPAGRAEVETHLGTCRACWEEAEELRQMLTLTTESLCDEPLPSVPYAFEARRLERVLGAARRRRSPRRRFLVLASTAMAACLMIAVGLPALLRTRAPRPGAFARMGAMQARSLGRRPTGVTRSLGQPRRAGYTRSKSLLSRLKGAVAGDANEDRKADSHRTVTRGKAWGDVPPSEAPASTPAPVTVRAPMSKTEAAKDATTIDLASVDAITTVAGSGARNARLPQGGGQAVPKRPQIRMQLETPGAGGRAAGDALIADGRTKNELTVYESYDIRGITLPGKKARRPRADQQLAGEPSRPGERGGEAYKPNASRRAALALLAANSDKDGPAKELEEAERVYAGVYREPTRQAAAMEAARKAAEAEAGAAAARAEESRRSELQALHEKLEVMKRAQQEQGQKRLSGYLAAQQKLAEKEKKRLSDELSELQQRQGGEMQRFEEAARRYDNALRRADGDDEKARDRKSQDKLGRFQRDENRGRRVDSPADLDASLHGSTAAGRYRPNERFAGNKRPHEADNAAIQGLIRNGIGMEGKRRMLANASALEGELRARHYYQVPDQQRTRTLRVPPPAIGDEGLGREGFRKRYGVNPFVDTQRDHLSTFAMDVDTASYTRTRALLRAGRLPDPKTVRVEEFVNAFPDNRHADPSRVFSVYTEGAPAPFAGGSAGGGSPVSQSAIRPLETIKITVKARELHPGERRPAVLTLAVDISGSMALGGRLGQVRGALAGLLDALEPEDRVAVVAYGSEAYLALPHTPARERARILGALRAVRTGGSTNVQAGLRLAYRVADESRAPGAWNRVIVCSDGVATSGAREADALLSDVKLYAKRGIDLTVLGFGKQGYNDAFLERLANRGNGNYAFCASALEGARLFQRNLPQTLSVLARDAKIQVDFDPKVVASYRLLGYENRDIKDADFRNDAVDAGEVGPGTQVTALYEIQRHPGAAGPLGRVFLRYHSTVIGRVEEVSFPIPPGVVATELRSAAPHLRFTACVAELAELLRESYWARDGSFANLVRELDRLHPALGGDPRWQEVRELAVRAGQLTVRRLLQGNR